MTTFQRLALLFGSVALIAVLLQTPSHQTVVEGVFLKANAHANLANLWDWQTALVQSLIVAAATLALYFACGKRRKD